MIVFGVGVMALTLFVAAVIYWIVHYKIQFVNIGRLTAFITIGIPTLLDQLNVLPWGTILSDAEAKLIAFGIALFMAIMHVSDTVKAAAVSAPAAPPAPIPNAPTPPAAQ